MVGNYGPKAGVPAGLREEAGGVRRCWCEGPAPGTCVRPPGCLQSWVLWLPVEGKEGNAGVLIGPAAASSWLGAGPRTGVDRLPPRSSSSLCGEPLMRAPERPKLQGGQVPGAA